MEETMVVFGLGYKETWAVSRENRKLFVLTTMSSSATKPSLKLLALGKCVLFAISTMPVANQ